MPYKYILKYRKNQNEYIKVEAWPKFKRFATKKEKNRPSFIIGSVKGSKTLILWHLIEGYEKKYKLIKNKTSFTILYPSEDATAINDAYRLGLAVAAVNSSNDNCLAQCSINYIMNSSIEEIWFWTSKFLGVLGNKTEIDRVLNSLYVISGGKKLGN